jgi:hypothetical protein
MSLVGSCTVRTPESIQVPSGKPIWQAGNIQILEEQIVIKPINKRFPLPLIAATVSIASHAATVCSLGDGK